jgi:hypothetical protein
MPGSDFFVCHNFFLASLAGQHSDAPDLRQSSFQAALILLLTLKVAVNE